MDFPQPQPVPATMAPPNNDAEHLRLLSIFHYVYAGVTALFACFPLIYVAIGIAMMSGQMSFEEMAKDAKKQQAPLAPAPANGLDNIPRPDDAAKGDEFTKEQLKELDENSRVVGMVIVGVGSGFVLLGWLFAALVAVAGRKLAKRRGRTFCIVVAALCCIMVPLGTILGVFTLIVLTRPSVQALFASGDRMQPW
jgi:hypothetical protein